MGLIWLALAAIAVWALVRLGRQTERNGRGDWRVAATLISAALLGGGLFAARARASGGVRHRVRLVEHDHAVEVGAQPIDDLLNAAHLLAAILRTERGVGDEQDALFEGDGFVDRPVRQGLDVGRKAPERGPVAPRVFE